MTKNAIKEMMEAELAKIQLLMAKFDADLGVSALDRDLLLTKLRKVYDMALDMPINRVVSAPVSVEPPKVIVPPEPAVQLDMTITSEPELKPLPEIVIPVEEHETVSIEQELEFDLTDDEDFDEDEEFEEIELDHSTHQAEPTLEPEIIIEEQPVIVKPIVKPQETVIPKEILAERFQRTKFLNDVFAEYGAANDISTKFQNQSLNDLFKAIGLNDKFLFIKELFNNDAILFKTTIERLNTLKSFEEAAKYIDQTFKWDFNQLAVQKLFDLLHRRFLKQ